MKRLANLIMAQRARKLFRRIEPHLPDSGTIADFGSGTGHNADQIRRRTRLQVNEYDIADLHWVGPGPVILRNSAIPVEDNYFAAMLVLFVLQYPESVSQVLLEARRVTRGPVIVVQSTCGGALGLMALGVREFFWGKLAFRLAVWTRLIPKSDCPFVPRRRFSRRELLDEFQRSGFVLRTSDQTNWPGLNLSRDLFVLESTQP